MPSSDGSALSHAARVSSTRCPFAPEGEPSLGRSTNVSTPRKGARFGCSATCGIEIAMACSSIFIVSSAACITAYQSACKCAKEPSPRRKPWVGVVGLARARFRGRKNAVRGTIHYMARRDSAVTGVVRELAFPVLAIAGLLLAVRYRHFILSVAAVVIGIVFWLIFWLGDFYPLWTRFLRHEPDKKDHSSDMGNLVP